MGWECARSEEQKEERVAGIIASTARLYKMHTFEEITFVLIAKEATFTRSNLYKYSDSNYCCCLVFKKSVAIKDVPYKTIVHEGRNMKPV